MNLVGGIIFASSYIYLLRTNETIESLKYIGSILKQDDCKSDSNRLHVSFMTISIVVMVLNTCNITERIIELGHYIGNDVFEDFWTALSGIIVISVLYFLGLIIIFYFVKTLLLLINI